MHNSILPLLLTMLSIFTQVSSHVLIITHAFNRPDFIELQCKTFQKFLTNHYEFVVFNDAPPGPIHDQIVEMCKIWQVECIPVPQELHDHYFPPENGLFSTRHVDGIHYSLEKRGFDHDDIMVLIDSDMFLIRPFSFRELLKDLDAAAVMRNAGGGIPYFWPGLTVLAMDRLPDKRDLTFFCGEIQGRHVDTGGFSYYYLLAHPELKRIELDQVFSHQIYCPDRHGNYDGGRMTAMSEESSSNIPSILRDMGFNENEINFILKKPDTINFACNNCFLHFRAACGWDGNADADYNKHKTILFQEFIDLILH